MAVVRAAARAVALVLGALRFGTQIGDFRQGAIAAIATIVCEDFQSVFHAVESPRQFRRTLDNLIERPPRVETSAAFFEQKIVNLPVGSIRRRRSGWVLLRSQVLAVDFGGRQARLGIRFEIAKLARLRKWGVRAD